MTVSTTTNKVSYIGNGFATKFAIPFPFLETSHLKVFQLLNDIQTGRTDWTVSGGDMVFETAPEDGARIIIIREVPLTQETDYRENEILAAETLERNFDSLTMQIQQLKEKSDRAVTVDVFDSTQAAELLPSIRQSVSDAAQYAETTRLKADEAEQRAENAALSAQEAAEQAQIATDKAREASDTLANKVNVSADNFSITGKRNLVQFSIPDYSAGIAMTISTEYQDILGNGILYYRGNSSGHIINNGIDIKLPSGEEIADTTSGGNYGFGGFIIVTTGCQVRVQNSYVTVLIFFPYKGEV